LHTDKEYDVTKSADCNYYTCCRDNGKDDSPFVKPGKYGSLRCDVPLRTVESMLKFINQSNFSAEFMTISGDYSVHDIWNTKPSEAKEYTTILSKKIKEHIDIPVIPAMGNHDVYPPNDQDFSLGPFKSTEVNTYA
jgi:sphingomyelin phosphodiesterase